MTTLIHGLDELAAGLTEQLAQLEAPKVKRALRNAAYAGAAKARDLIRERTPQHSGLLRKAIVARNIRPQPPVLAAAGVHVRGITQQRYANTRKNRRAGRVGQTYTVDSPAYYWRFLEFGTSKQSAAPFVRPTLTAGQDQIHTAIVSRLQQAIEEALYS